MMQIRAILVLLVAGAIHAQPAARAQFPLETLRVEGNREIPAEKIAAASGLKIGRTVVKEDFEAARKRLMETGAFEQVGYEYKPSAAATGYDAVIEVTEVGQLFPYRLEDLPMSDTVLREALRKQEPLWGDRIPASDGVIQRYAKAIQQALGGNVTVAGKLEADAPGGLAIVFRPPASRPNIAEVHFQGNDALPSAVLMRTISQVAIGIPYTEQNMRQRLEAAIRPLYEARGRIRVTFPQIATAPAPQADGVVVTVTVNEGASYNLGGVRLTGVASSQTAELQKTADWKKGDVVNFDDIKAGLDRIYKRYRNNGYLRVTGDVQRDIHDDSHTVDLTVALQPGPQYHFGKLTIEGLDILSEPAIRKAWGPMEGKPFQPGYADAFLARLREEEVFDNLGKTRSETRTDEATKIVDVTLYFSGGRPDPKKKLEAPPPDPPVFEPFPVP